MRRLLPLVAVVALTACNAAPAEAPTITASPPPATASASPETSAPPATRASAPRTKAVDAALVARCTAFPSALVARGCDLAAGAGAAAPLFCVQLGTTTAPDLDLFIVAIFRGRSQFESVAHLPPSVADQFDGGIAATYAAFEGPERIDVAPGRVATRRARGAFLGGAVTWATLASADGAHDLVLAVHQVLHDYPVTKAELDALRAIDLASAMRCLDAAIWPR